MVSDVLANQMHGFVTEHGQVSKKTKENGRFELLSTVVGRVWGGQTYTLALTIIKIFSTAFPFPGSLAIYFKTGNPKNCKT